MTIKLAHIKVEMRNRIGIKTDTYLNVTSENNVKRNEVAKKTRDLIKERVLKKGKDKDRNRDEGK